MCLCWQTPALLRHTSYEGYPIAVLRVQPFIGALLTRGLQRAHFQTEPRRYAAGGHVKRDAEMRRYIPQLG